MTDIGYCERDLQIMAIIKSNLVSFGLNPEQIDKIVIDTTQDIVDILVNFEQVHSRGEEE